LLCIAFVVNQKVSRHADYLLFAQVELEGCR
jgi:hypothetical protein